MHSANSGLRSIIKSRMFCNAPRDKNSSPGLPSMNHMFVVVKAAKIVVPRRALRVALAMLIFAFGAFSTGAALPAEGLRFSDKANPYDLDITTRERLAPLQVGKYGQLREWLGNKDAPKDTHRHLSHLCGLFPGAQITPDNSSSFNTAGQRSSGHGPATGASYDTLSGSASSNDGAVRITKNRVLTSAHSPAGLANNSGSSTLQLDGSAGGISLPQPVYLSGRGSSIAAIQNLSKTDTISGMTIWSGGANYLLQSDSGLLNFSGSISSGVSGTRTMTFQGNGDFVVSSSLANGTADQLMSQRPRAAL
jgi:hypothetical protein